MTKGRSRLDWVDTGRGIAIILVVLYHSTNWLAGTGLDLATWANISVILSSLRMPLFFVLSGLFAAKWLSSDWRSLFRVKILLFAWVFAIWSTIGMVVQLTGLHVAGQQVNVKAGVRDLLLSPLVPRFELWFIWALVVCFIVAKATRKVPWIIQLAVTGIGSAVALTIWLNVTTGLTGSAKFYFFFLVGLYLRSAIIWYAAASRWLHAAVLVAWGVLSIALFNLGLRDVPGVYFLNCVIGIFAGVALSRFLTKAEFLQRFGRKTLPIYLAHTPIVILISIVLIGVPPLLTIVAHVTPIVAPVGAALALTGALWLYRVAQRSWLRYLYEPPEVAARVIGGSR